MEDVAEENTEQVHAPDGTESVRMCFGCGPDNPWGLKLDFRNEGDLYVADFKPKEEYQGYPGILHGGIICTLLDEAMGRLLWAKGLKFPTGKLEVKFRRPARLDATFCVEASILSWKGRAITCCAVLRDTILDEIVAEGKGVFLAPSEMVLGSV